MAFSREYYLELSSRLQVLRPLLLRQERAACLNWFDEYLEHNELGLALDVLCEYLLEPGAPRVTEAELGQLEALFSIMGVQNRPCIAALQQMLP